MLIACGSLCLINKLSNMMEEPNNKDSSLQCPTVPDYDTQEVRYIIGKPIVGVYLINLLFQGDYIMESKNSA